MLCDVFSSGYGDSSIFLSCRYVTIVEAGIGFSKVV